jgi:two-component system response regulator FixJ
MPSPRAIAIVDDDALVRSGMVSLVRSFGLAATPFASGEAFLAAGPENWDCLISDIHMPDMSGLELLRRLSVRHPALPVVIMTGFPDEHVRAQALEAGAASFLEKPCAAEDVLSALERAVGPIGA